MAFKQNRALVWTTYIGSGYNGINGNVDGISGIAIVGDSILYTAGYIFNGTNTHTDYPLVDFNTGNPLDWYQDTTPNFSATINRWDISGIGASVGIAEEAYIDGDVIVFPNPASDEAKILINVKGDGGVNLRIFDISGKLVDEKSFADGKRVIQIAVNKYSSGTYILNIEIEGKTYRRKFIIH